MSTYHHSSQAGRRGVGLTRMGSLRVLQGWPHSVYCAGVSIEWNRQEAEWVSQTRRSVTGNRVQSKPLCTLCYYRTKRLLLCISWHPYFVFLVTMRESSDISNITFNSIIGIALNSILGIALNSIFGRYSTLSTQPRRFCIAFSLSCGTL